MENTKKSLLGTILSPFTWLLSKIFGYFIWLAGWVITGLDFLIVTPFRIAKAFLYRKVFKHILFWKSAEKKEVQEEWQLQQIENGKERRNQWEDGDTKEFLLNNAIYLVILLLILIVIILEPSFLKLSVFEKILKQSSVRLILALGVGGIIILQGTDLSLGRSVGFAAVITAALMQTLTFNGRFYPEMPEFIQRFVAIPKESGIGFDTVLTYQWWWFLIPLVIAMIVSGFFSMINGFVVSVFKVHPFLATLGASVAMYGILSMYYSSPEAGPQPIGDYDMFWERWIIGEFLGIPLLIIYAALVTLIMWFVWNKTTFGKNMYAVGGNPEAAKISGVNVVKTTVLVYIVAGLLYGLGGYLEVARIGSASNTTGQNYELDAIAACVVGGISFSGGIGKISGAVAGVLMFTIISFGMNFLALDVFYQYIVKGVIIVLAVALDTRKYIKKS